MNSRECVLAAINHKQPDHLPLDLGATPSTGISAIAYNNLRKKLGIYHGSAKIYDVVQQVAQPDDDIIKMFGIDVIDVARAFNTSTEDWCSATLADGSEALLPKWFHPVKCDKGGYDVFAPDGDCIAHMPNGGTFYDQTFYPYINEYPDNYKDLDRAMSKVLWQAMAHSPWDNTADSKFWGKLRENALKLRNETDKALTIVCGCNLFEWGTFLRRMDNFLMDIYTEPEEVEKLLDALMERHLATLEKVCNTVGDIVDILRFGDDLGMDSGPFMAPEIYRKIFKPRHAKLNEYVHKHSGMKTFLHSCGSIYKLMPDLIDAGYDIINPVQTTAAGMDPAILKREFGKDITFWGGGCNTRSILNRGSAEEVYDYTKRMIEIFHKDGGFVFNTEHNILSDVPAENILAMYKAVGEYK